MEYSQRKRRVIYTFPPKFALSAAHSLECRASFCYGFYKKYVATGSCVDFALPSSASEKLGMPFIQASPNIDETPLPTECAQALVTRLSYEKRVL